MAPTEQLTAHVGDPVESAPWGYALIGHDGLVVRANAEFRRLVDREPHELVGTATLESLLSTGGCLYLETHLRPTLRHDGWVREVALDLVRPDRTRVPVLFNADTMTGQGFAFRGGGAVIDQEGACGHAGNSDRSSIVLADGALLW